MFRKIATTAGSLIVKVQPKTSSGIIRSSIRSTSSNSSQRRNHHHLNVNETKPVKTIDNYIKTPLLNATTSADKEILTMEFADNSSLDFPSVWLRDNCRCSDCYDHLAQSRLIDQVDFRPESIPSSVKVEEENVKIVWDDGHRSEYQKEWMCNHSFEPAHQHDREELFHEKQEHWNAETFPKVYKTFTYNEVMTDDKVLLQWLLSLARQGVTMVTGAPEGEKTVETLANKVAFIKKTLYGDIFHVKSKPGATNTAYKKGQLQMHSDMPFYQHLPGSIFLHCIVQSENGGENLLTDAFNVAKQLSPEQYRLLTETVINWSDIGSDKNFHFHSLNREPCICEDKLGNIKKINWSQPQRDSRFDVPVGVAIEWYKAMKAYTMLLHHPSNAVILKMQPGDILTFDNRRILHSRANYSDGARQLNGAYLDWDEIYPKIRVLKKNLNAS